MQIVCAGGAFFSCKHADLYQWGNAIDGSITSSMEFISISGGTRDETGQMHPRMNALIHGWGKYPWMKTLHEWGATHIIVARSHLFFVQNWIQERPLWGTGPLSGLDNLFSSEFKNGQYEEPERPLASTTSFCRRLCAIWRELVGCRVEA